MKFIFFLIAVAFADNATETALKKAVDWLVSQRQEGNWTWGQGTPRAATALLLADGVTDPKDRAILKAKLRIHFLKNFPKIESSGNGNPRKASALISMLAACMPVEETESVKRFLSTPNPTDPFLELAHCLLSPSPRTPRRPVDFKVGNAGRDALWVLQLKCFSIKKNDTTLEDDVQNLINKLMDFMDTDPLSPYTTALLAQAFTLSTKQNPWKRAVAKLITFQDKNGSFGDLYGTYLALPALAKTSLAALATSTCNLIKKPTLDLMEHYVSLKYDRAEIILKLSAPKGIKFFDLLDQASRVVSNFRYETVTFNNKTTILKVNNIPNDGERSYYWKVAKFCPSNDPNRKKFIFMDPSKPTQGMYKYDSVHDLSNIEACAHNFLYYY